jgi:5-methylcytosine-specific restriction protein A
MPLAARRPCAMPGCAALVSRARYCSAHAAQRGFSSSTRQEVERSRGNRHERGYTNDWVKASRAFRLAHPLCVRCEQMGRLTPTAVTDHIVPHKGDRALFWDRSNWQPLCKSCHDAKTAREDGPARAMPEWMPTPSCEVTLVCGPPGSGKTTLVRERAAPGDTIIDLDDILAELSGLPRYTASVQWLSRGLRERNRRLANLSRAASDHHAWVIVTGPKHKRRWWVERLVPHETIVLNVDEHVCVARVMNDEARVSVRQRHIEAIRAWWAAERAT